MAAFYGVNKMPMAELSFEEIQRMRQIVQMHDAQRAPMQTIDLNNPPKEPYRFQKFPTMVYDHEHSSSKKIINKAVYSQDELDAAVAEGWVNTPPSFSEEREESLSASYQMEVAQVQEKLEQTKRKPGRPRNTEVA